MGTARRAARGAARRAAVRLHRRCRAARQRAARGWCASGRTGGGLGDGERALQVADGDGGRVPEEVQPPEQLDLRARVR